jgi:hypothetical protein
MAFPNPFDLQHHRSGPDGDLVEQFLSTYSKRPTRRSYRSDLQQFFGREPVTRQEAAQMQEENITGFLKERADSLKRTTLKRKLETLRSFFRWLAEQDVIEALPIGEELDTSDLVEQVLQDASGATDGKRTRQREEGATDTGQYGPEPLPGGLIPRELEPGSELELGRETAPRRDKSGSSSLRGGPSQDGEHEEKSGSGENESSPSETSSSQTSPSETPPSDTSPREEHPDEESTEAGPPVSDGAVSDAGSIEEGSARDRQPEEIPDEDSTGGASAGDDAGGTNSGGQSPPGPPQWAFSTGEAADVDLEAGERIALADLPAALRGALRRLEGPGRPEGLFLRCTDDLGIRIRYHQGQESARAEVTLEHRAFRRILRSGTLRTGEDPSEQAALRRAIVYLAGRDWMLPCGLYDHVGALPGPEDTEGPSSEEKPRWTQEGADNLVIQIFVAAKITGTLAEGFGLEKEEKVFLGR